MKVKNEFVIAIGGKAGQGVLSMGGLIQQLVHDLGLYSFVWVDYPSLIKGGHNVVFVRISDKPVHCPVDYITYLITLDAESIDIHWDEIIKNGVSHARLHFLFIRTLFYLHYFQSILCILFLVSCMYSLF